MNLSMTSGAKEVQKQYTGAYWKSWYSSFKRIINGGAWEFRCYSYPNYSVDFRNRLKKKSTINSKEFAQAFEAGVETAYKAVMKPVEGTILTVAKDAAKKPNQSC